MCPQDEFRLPPGLHVDLSCEYADQAQGHRLQHARSHMGIIIEAQPATAPPLTTATITYPPGPHRMGRLLNALEAGLGRPETRHRHHAPQEHVHLAIGQRRLLPAAAGDDDKGLWYVHIPPHCAPKQSYLCWRRMIIAVLSNVQPVYRFPVMGYCVSAKSISVGRCIGSLA